MVTGSYYSQDAHTIENSKYRNPEFAQRLNENFINVIIDRDEDSSFEHFFHSIVHCLLKDVGAVFMLVNHGNLPLVAVLDGNSLLPKVLCDERTDREINLLGDVEAQLALISYDRPVVETSNVISFSPRKSDSKVHFPEYAENLLKETPVKTSELVDQLTRAINTLRTQSHPVGANLYPNMFTHGKFAALLLETSNQSGDISEDRTDLALSLLTRLGRSSYFDHLGGGFFQSHYDENATVSPSAIKHLGLCSYFLELYCDALEVTDDVLFENIVSLTAKCLVKHRLWNRFFPCSVADLTQVGSSHYEWTKRDLKRILSEDEHLLIETLYGFDRRSRTGGNSAYHLARTDSWVSVVDRLFLDEDEAEELHQSARDKLLEEKDDSVLSTDERFDFPVTAAAIKALVRSAYVLGKLEYLEIAQESMNSVLEIYLGRFSENAPKDSDIGINSLSAVDLLYVLDALMALLEFAWEERYFRWCKRFARDLQKLYIDSEYQLFVKQRRESKKFVPDPQPFLDYSNFRESVSVVAIRTLYRLAQLLGDESLMRTAQNQIRVIQNSMTNPLAHADNLMTVAKFEKQPPTVVLYGDDVTCRYWKYEILNKSKSSKFVYVVPACSPVARPPYVRKFVDESPIEAIAYICGPEAEAIQIMELDTLLERLA